tara:strand:- start:489 stop:599 length:111 start_codon:yes stop_codon:yes gene_type:complete
MGVVETLDRNTPLVKAEVEAVEAFKVATRDLVVEGV